MEDFSEDALEYLAELAVRRVGRFGSVVPARPEARRYADTLRRYATGGKMLVVGDAMVEPAVMEEARSTSEAVGVVILANEPYPEWVTPLFFENALVQSLKADLQQLRERVLYWQPSAAHDALKGVDQLGSARNNLLLRVGLVEDDAGLVRDAAALLEEWSRAGSVLEEVRQATHGWLARFNAFAGHEGRPDH